MTAHVWYGALLFSFCSSSEVADCASNFLTVTSPVREPAFFHQSRWRAHYFPDFFSFDEVVGQISLIFDDSDVFDLGRE